MKDNDDNDRDKEDRETYGVRDVLGKYDYTHSTKKDNTPDIKQKYRKSPLALAHLDAMTKSMKKSDVQIIKEIEVLDEQLNGNEKD